MGRRQAVFYDQGERGESIEGAWASLISPSIVSEHEAEMKCT